MLQHCMVKVLVIWAQRTISDSTSAVFMPQTLKKLMGHIGFCLSVCPSVCQDPCKLGFWNFIYGFLMEKYLTHIFFSCPNYLPFWSYAPLNKVRMKSDACHILWTVHARVLKFHIWNSHGKIVDLYFFFLVQVTSLSGVMPLWKNQNEILSARCLEKYLS